MSSVARHGFDVTAWQGIVAPRGIPKPIVDRLSRDTVKVLQIPEVQEGFRREGLEIMTGVTAEQAAAQIRDESLMWTKIIKNAGIKGE